MMNSVKLVLAATFCYSVLSTEKAWMPNGQPDCAVLRPSVNGAKHPPGCAGAVMGNGSPVKSYCQNYGGKMPWYKACCDWKGNKCVAKPPPAPVCDTEILTTKVNLAVAIKKGAKTPMDLVDEEKDPICECAELCAGAGKDIFQYYSKVKKGQVQASCKCMSLGKKVKAKTKTGWTAGALTSNAQKAFNKMKIKVSKKDKKS